jgi:pectate lyase
MNPTPFKSARSSLAGWTCAAALSLLGASPLLALPAFPGAEGFGAAATGGRGGEIYHVTNLNDSGKGSFRDAVSKPHRMVVFDVGGYVDLKSAVQIADNLTIAGQTAPGMGIGVKNYEVSVSKGKNIIVRYMRFRLGLTPKMEKKYSIGCANAETILFDHCSIEWGRWDCIGMEDSKNLTYQYCIIGEGIDPQRFGCICESDNVTFSHDLWINDESRNPKAKGTIQYINNVVYNWGVGGLVGGHSEADHTLDAINNYFIKGPSSVKSSPVSEYWPSDKVYQVGNYVKLTPGGTLDGRLLKDSDFTDTKDNKGPTFMKKASLASPTYPVTVDTAEAAFAKVVASAGCSIQRDAIDQRLIKDAQSLGASGKLIKDPEDVGGFGTITGGTPPQDSDQDGIPDAWETAHGLNPNDPSDASKLDPSGYTNLEVYLNSLVPSSTPPTPAPAVAAKK